LIQQTIEKVLISGLKSLTIINKAASSAGVELGIFKVNYTASLEFHKPSDSCWVKNSLRI